MATRRARLDFELLSAAGRSFSRPLEEVPAAVAALQESAKYAAKQVKGLTLDLASYKGRALYAAAAGGRHWERVGAVDESTRALAQAFVGCGPGVFLATGGGAVLVASSDSAVHCGNLLKQFGRGGGTAAFEAVKVVVVGAIALLIEP